MPKSCAVGLTSGSGRTCTRQMAFLLLFGKSQNNLNDRYGFYELF